MNLPYDPIPVFEAAGYTEREAAFLYLAALHSGYFLRRQYLRFIERGRGALAAQFLRRASALGHIQSIACGQARFVYHVHASAVYDAAGLAALRHRRLKGDASIKSRLMVLDFVLDHLDDSMLDTRESKIHYFTSISEEKLPRVYGIPFADDFPILLGEPMRFTFFDEGALSSSTFERFLGRYRSVFDVLPGFELLYVSDSEENIKRASPVFATARRALHGGGASSLTPKGFDHLVEYALARERVEARNEPPTLRDLAVLREGERIYTTPQHEVLLTALESGDGAVERVRSKLLQQGGRVSFLPVVLTYQYPLHRFKFEKESKPELGSSEGSSASTLLEP